MAFLPKYESRQSATTQDTFRPLPAMTEGYQDMQKLGQLATNVALEVDKINSVREKTQAQLDTQRKLGDIKERAAKDPDPNNALKYEQEIDAVIAESGSGISNPGTRKNFSFIAQELGDTYKRGVRNESHQKIVDQAKYTVALSKQQTIDIASQGTDITAIAGSVQSHIDVLDSAVQNGLITKEQRDLEIYNMQKDVARNRMENLIATNPQAALDSLNATGGTELMKYGMSEKDVAGLKKSASDQAKIKADVDKVKVTTMQLSNFTKTMDEMIASDFQQYTPSQIRAMADRGEISATQANLMVKRIQQNPTLIADNSAKIVDLTQRLFEFYKPGKKGAPGKIIKDKGMKARTEFVNAWHDDLMKLVADGYVEGSTYKKMVGYGAGLVMDEVKMAQAYRANKSFMRTASYFFENLTTDAGGPVVAFTKLLMEKTIKNERVTPQDTQDILVASMLNEDPLLSEEQARERLSNPQPKTKMTYNIDTGRFE